MRGVVVAMYVTRESGSRGYDIKGSHCRTAIGAKIGS